MEQATQAELVKERFKSKYTPEEKRQRVFAWEYSRESRKHHAELAGVHTMTLYEWIKKYGSQPNSPSPKFAQARLVGSPEALRINFPGGAYLKIDQPSDFETIARLLKVMGTHNAMAGFQLP